MIFNISFNSITRLQCDIDNDSGDDEGVVICNYDGSDDAGDDGGADGNTSGGDYHNCDTDIVMTIRW